MYTPHEAPPSEVVRSHVWRSALGLRARLHTLGVRGYWLFAALSLLALVVPSVGAALSSAMALGALGAIGLMVAGVAASYEVSDACTATLTPHGIRLQGLRDTTDLCTEQLASGLVRWDRGGWQLRLQTRDGTRYDLDLLDRETGERWLRALSLDAQHRAVRVVTNRRLLQGVFAYFFGGFFSSPLMALVMVLMTFAGLPQHDGVSLVLTYLYVFPGYYFAARLVGRADVTVGVDGVRIGKLFRSRFLPFATLLGAEVLGNRSTELWLRTVHGASERVVFASASDAAAVCERVREGLNAWHVAPRSELLAAFGDAPATAEAWRDRFLDALRPGGYRAVMVTPGEVESVVSAGYATTAQRVGAVLALRALSPDQAPTGVRVCVDVSADREAQEALDAALREASPKSQARG